MVSIDEVRARVQAAAQRQIQQRTDTAADVATAVQDVTQKKTALGAAQTVLDEAMRAALAVMSLDELAEFTGFQKAHLPVPTNGRKSSGRATSRRRSPANGEPTVPPAPDASTSTSAADASGGHDDAA